MARPHEASPPRPRSERPNWIGRLLTRRRQQFGLTQQAAADLLGVSRYSYHTWETTSEGPTKPRLQRKLLLFALGVLEVDGDVVIPADD